MTKYGELVAFCYGRALQLLGPRRQISDVVRKSYPRSYPCTLDATAVAERPEEGVKAFWAMTYYGPIKWMRTKYSWASQMP